jgi:uncharacterized membrane protein YphA (DoxX/SURF4 family)
MADVALSAEATQPTAIAEWSLLHRVLFRFACCYWLLYALPERGRSNVFAVVPGSQFLWKPYINLWHTITPWVATRLFHVTGRPATYFPTGSGDTTLQYVQTLLYFAAALMATLVWSLLDRRRMHYHGLQYWLRLMVRYTLAFTLFSYGFAKVFPLQFQPPWLGRLIEPYGEFSPMGVLWNFMGASIPYTIFSGAAEVTGGLLLIFRRTTSLGALVSFAVLFNVAVLNYCYDVPVKLYSTHLVLMALFLLAPDLRRLLNVLVLNRPAAAADLTGPRFERRWLRLGAVVFQVLLVGYVLFSHVTSGWHAYKKTYITPQRPPLYGLYDVESGPPKWRKVFFAFPGNFGVRTTEDRVINFSADYGNDNSITVNHRDRLAWSRPDPDHVLLEGRFDGLPTTLRLRKIDTSKMLLFNRGFHWINETPLNR